MYGIFTYIWSIFMVNVAKYIKHECYGLCYEWFGKFLQIMTYYFLSLLQVDAVPIFQICKFSLQQILLYPTKSLSFQTSKIDKQKQSILSLCPRANSGK